MAASKATSKRRPRRATQRRFEVRTNCEYILQIEADSEEAALAKAEEIDLDEWDQAWAEMEAEPIGEAND
jgi:hypothetical protein